METGTSGISGVIDTSKIEAMVAQLKAAAARASGEAAPTDAASGSAQGAEVAPRVDFANVLKSQLDGVASLQQQAAQQSKAYSMGDNSVSLSDLMIAGQKAGIALQTTIQVRNKILSAYTEIMNMQV